MCKIKDCSYHNVQSVNASIWNNVTTSPKNVKGVGAELLVDLAQVDCENAKASDSQDDKSEGQLSNLAEKGFEKV